MTFPNDEVGGMRERAFDYLIIGGGAAGLSCAETIRRKDRESSIAILSADKELPYSRVMLPEYVMGKVTREEVFLRTRDQFVASNITIDTGIEITELDAEAKWVLSSAGERIHFGCLCIATGGIPKTLTQGAQDAAQHLFGLHSLADADRLRDVVSTRDGVKWIIIGGGFIGIEIANIVHHYGGESTLLTPHKQLFEGLMTKKGADMIANVLEGTGCKIVYDTRATGVVWQNDLGSVATERESFGPAHVAIGIGIDRVQSWFGAVGDATGITTNAELYTAREGIFAAGDVAIRPDEDGKHIVSGAWASAVQMGMVAGTNMLGGHLTLSTPAVYSITVGKMHATFIGNAGDVSGDVVERDVSASSRIEFTFVDDKLVRVVLVNAQSETGQCMRLLSAHATLGARRAQFANVGVALSTL